MNFKRTAIYKKLFTILCLILAMVAGAFGGYSVNFVKAGFKSFANNILSTGYGCGTFGQSDPSYNNACVVSSSAISQSSSFIQSSSTLVVSSISSVVNSINSQTSSQLTQSSIRSSTTSSISATSNIVSRISSNLLSSVSSTILNTNPSISIKVNLSGNFVDSNDTMTTSLNSLGIIPLTQPYNVSPFNYNGIESVATRSQIPSNVVDWILVEIKNDSGVTFFKKALFLTSSGDIIDPTTGSNVIILNNLAPVSSAKVIVRHKNHLAIATNSNINFANNATTNVDFTKNMNVKSQNQERVGTNSNNQILYGMRKANTNGNDTIDAGDRSHLSRSQESYRIYSSDDVNLDGSVDALDRSLSFLAPEAAENI